MKLKNRIGAIDWKYIIIEISIIVVGILIAFQVDSWKEERSTRLKELKILHELNSELLGDLKSVNEMNKRCDGVIKSLGVLQMHLFQKQPYGDSLQDHAFKIVYRILFEHRSSAFENLRTIGTDLISNDSLKSMLIELYEYGYPKHLKIIDIEANNEEYRNYYERNRILKYKLNDENRKLEIDELINPKIFDDPRFLDIVTEKMGSFIIVKRHLKSLQDELTLLIEAISNEVSDS